MHSCAGSRSGKQIATRTLQAAKAHIGGKMFKLQPKLFTYGDGDEAGEGGGASSQPPSYALLGRRCTSEDPQLRPTFEEVLKSLERVRADYTASLQSQWDLEPDPDEDC